MNAFPASVLSAVLLLTGASFGADAVAKFADKQFTFPSDYTLERAAGQPLVERPIEAFFDDKGRLYVTESSGSNEPVVKQLTSKPHRVLRLVDTDGDGVFDQRSVFADGLMLPQGCLWHEGSVYVAAPPQIWKFTDADDDGVAEKREVWFDGKTLTGCANDLHGPYAGPDGWLYWCKGAFAEQTYDLPGQPGWKTTASHVFRARPDGASLEPVFTAGMDNPVGLEWTAEGELIVAGTFLQDPEAGRRDGLIHAVYGGVWGKAHGVLAGHPRTGALMPAMTHMGPGAPCGIARYGRDMLVAQFNLRTVSRHQMIPDGATYRTEDSPFLTCDHPDFHPTDVLQAPDGSVLIVDTGGWYKLCCPTSQIAKPDVLGGIYRLRRKGGEIPVTKPPALWTIGDPADISAQIANLSAPDAQVRRRAAEALGRAKAVASVSALIEALAAPDVDRVLFHSLAYALLQIGDAAAVRPALESANATVQAAALYALEQMPERHLAANEVITRLSTTDARLQEAAVFVVGRHQEWAPELAAWCGERLHAMDQDDAALRSVIRSFTREPAIRKWLGAALANTDRAARQTFLLRLMAEAPGKQLPEEWVQPLKQLLSAGTAIDAVLKVLRAVPPHAEFDAILRQIAGDAKTAPSLRVAALARASATSLDDGEFELVLAQLRAGDPEAAPILARTRLNPAQQLELAPLVGVAGILERPLLLKAFAGSKDAAVGAALLQSLTGSLSSLPRDAVMDAFAAFPADLREKLTAAQNAGTPPDRRARLDELEKSLPAGDPVRGVAVFQSAKATCATCHPVGYKGGRFGPDLSKIGAVRTRRDLIEAIVFPSASFVRSYETAHVTRRDRTETFGIVSDQDGEVISVTTSPSTPATSIPRSEITSILPAPFSMMPQGFDTILSNEELADIVAYLQSMR